LGTKIKPAVALVAALLPWISVAGAADALHLRIGDPARRDREAPVVLDGIADTRRDRVIGVEELVAQLRDVNVLFVGEEHTNIDFHRVQAHVITALKRAGRDVMVGLEMMPYTQQAYLDRWTRGQYPEAEFLEASGWYEHWGYRWEYYADIFRLARDNGIRLFGVNAPRHVIKAVRTQGFDGLTEEDLQHIPASVNTDSEDHRTLFKAYFSADDALHMNLSDDALDGMIRAQATWDAVMGWNAARAVQRQGSPTSIIVVLIGAGHVTYGLGAERQIRDGYQGRIASLVPVPVRSREGRAIESVQASYADFVWGVPAVEPTAYPTLGVSLAGSLGAEPNKIIQVDEASIAAAAGVQTGDRLDRVGGQVIGSVADLRRAMAQYYWGDSTEILVTRGGKPLNLRVLFRRPLAP
jgi:uncharacterized iron-regulated protein